MGVLKQSFKKTKKLRNHFSHKEGLLHQDQLEKKKYKIFNEKRKEEYISYEEINQIKTEIAGIMPLYFMYSMIILSNHEFIGEYLAYNN